MVVYALASSPASTGTTGASSGRCGCSHAGRESGRLRFLCETADARALPWAGLLMPLSFPEALASSLSPAQRLGKAAAAAVCVPHTQGLHTGMRCKRKHMDTQLLVAQMIWKHAECTAALNLAAPFWEQQSEGKSTLRRLVCLPSKTAYPHRAGMQYAVQARALATQPAYSTAMS